MENWMSAAIMTMVILLCTVLGRMTAVEDQIMEVASAANAIGFLVFIGCRAWATDDVGDKDRIDAWTMPIAPIV